MTEEKFVHLHNLLKDVFVLYMNKYLYTIKNKRFKMTNKERSEYRKAYSEKQKARTDKIIPKEKKCCKCKETKSSKEFHIANSNTDGLGSICKDCKREYNKSIKDKLYSSTKKISKRYKDRSDEEIVYPERKSCYKCGEEKEKSDFYKCRSRKSGLSDACKDCTLKYREENKEQRRNYISERRKNDPEYRMYCSLQKRLAGALKISGVKKTQRTMKLVGCNTYEFISHIESLWVDGMSWENYGQGYDKWCLDHIKPCASFNLLDESEQKKCFNYTNIQPLWNKDNGSKSSWWNGTKYTRRSHK